MAPYLLVRRELFSVTLMDGRVRVWRRRGQDLFQDNVVAETKMFSGGSIMVWGCFSHDHKLDLKVVRHKLRQGNVTLTISWNLLCIRISEHIKQQAPYFRTTMPIHIGHELLQTLLHRRGLRIFSGRAGATI